MSDILERIKELKKKKSALNQEAAKIREYFETYITDQSIYLGERWDLFSQSPDELTIKLHKEAMKEILSQNCGSFCLDC